ncbi:hypothetical protein C4578_00010 [Candidatus Microgenomates bacterium]|jgi:hypothetical protein|nr:MAG: hypothetical protein C4578_00010 [Candidatus Microgenomates bacterium]
MRILPSITTTRRDHKLKLTEAGKIGLEEVCFFATGLLAEARKEFYGLLGKSSIKKIPFVHLRSDMELWELDFLTEKFGTEVFNCHSPKEYPLQHDLSKYKNRIFVENTVPVLTKEDLEGYAGICLDIAHLENDRLLRKEKYEKNLEMMKSHKIGCCHISGLGKNKQYDPVLKVEYYDLHFISRYSELDYLKNYCEYIPEITAIELENSLEEQLKAKVYIEKILGKKGKEAFSLKRFLFKNDKL